MKTFFVYTHFKSNHMHAFCLYTIVQIEFLFCINFNNLFVNPYLSCIIVNFWFYAKHAHIFVKQKYFYAFFPSLRLQENCCDLSSVVGRRKIFVLRFHSIFYFLPWSRAVCTAYVYRRTKALARNRGKRFWKNRFTVHCALHDRTAAAGLGADANNNNNDSSNKKKKKTITIKHVVL